mgnify:CR=1 FL=1
MKSIFCKRNLNEISETDEITENIDKIEVSKKLKLSKNEHFEKKYENFRQIWSSWKNEIFFWIKDWKLKKVA